MDSMNPKLIILVEDDVNLRQSIALILQRAGYVVTATECVYKALDLLRVSQYHLIISDIDIPETKKVLLPQIIGKYPKLSIVILTDQTGPNTDTEGKPLRAHYLVKPVSPERLLESISVILDREDKSRHHTLTSFLDEPTSRFL